MGHDSPVTMWERHDELCLKAENRRQSSAEVLGLAEMSALGPNGCIPTPCSHWGRPGLLMAIVVQCFEK